MIKKALVLSTLALSMTVMAQNTITTDLGNTYVEANSSSGSNSGSLNQENKNGYLTDSSGNVVKSGYDLCWRTSSYDASYTYAVECDGVRSKPVVVRAPVVEPAVAQKPEEPRWEPVPQSEVKTVVLFNFDSYKLQEAEKVKIDSIINKDAYYSLNVVGHADPIGNETYNLRLSEKRAETVYRYLISKGISQNNIEVYGAGESAPVVECGNRNTRKDIECNAPNRRVEIITK